MSNLPDTVTQVRVAAFRADNGARLRDVWVEQRDNGQLPVRSGEPLVKFGAASTVTRESTCIHPGAFSHSSDPDEAVLCGYCFTWVSNESL